MAFAAEASIGRGAHEVENSHWSLLAGLVIAAALIAMAASSYVGSLRFSPSSLTVSQTQIHSSPASMAQSKSGASSSSGTTFSASGIVPESEGMISSQAAASAFDNVSR
jgi:hypothetical protein